MAVLNWGPVIYQHQMHDHSVLFGLLLMHPALSTLHQGLFVNQQSYN